MVTTEKRKEVRAFAKVALKGRGDLMKKMGM